MNTRITYSLIFTLVLFCIPYFIYSQDLKGNNVILPLTSGTMGNIKIGQWSAVNMYGIKNIYLGHAANLTSPAADSNSAIGFCAFRNVTTGSRNTLFGAYAGGRITSEDGNVWIGNEAGNNPIFNGKDGIGGIDITNTDCPLVGFDFNNDTVYICGYLKVNGGSNISGTGSSDTCLWYDYSGKIRNKSRQDVVIDSALYLTGLVSEPRLRYVLAWEHTTGNVFPVPIDQLGDTIVVDHGTLIGLEDDDHLQYPLLTGRPNDHLHIDTISDITNSVRLILKEYDTDVGNFELSTIKYEGFDFPAKIYGNPEEGLNFEAPSVRIVANTPGQGVSFFSALNVGQKHFVIDSTGIGFYLEQRIDTINNILRDDEHDLPTSHAVYETIQGLAPLADTSLFEIKPGSFPLIRPKDTTLQFALGDVDISPFTDSDIAYLIAVNNHDNLFESDPIYNSYLDGVNYFSSVHNPAHTTIWAGMTISTDELVNYVTIPNFFINSTDGAAILQIGAFASDYKAGVRSPSDPYGCIVMDYHIQWDDNDIDVLDSNCIKLFGGINSVMFIASPRKSGDGLTIPIFTNFDEDKLIMFDISLYGGENNIAYTGFAQGAGTSLGGHTTYPDKINEIVTAPCYLSSLPEGCDFPTGEDLGEVYYNQIPTVAEDMTTYGWLSNCYGYDVSGQDGELITAEFEGDIYFTKDLTYVIHDMNGCYAVLGYTYSGILLPDTAITTGDTCLFYADEDTIKNKSYHTVQLEKLNDNPFDGTDYNLILKNNSTDEDNYTAIGFKDNYGDTTSAAIVVRGSDNPSDYSGIMDLYFRETSIIGDKLFAKKFSFGNEYANDYARFKIYNLYIEEAPSADHTLVYNSITEDVTALSGIPLITEIDGSITNEGSLSTAETNDDGYHGIEISSNTSISKSPIITGDTNTIESLYDRNTYFFGVDTNKIVSIKRLADTALAIREDITGGPGGWVGTATSDLSMQGYNIDSVGMLGIGNNDPAFRLDISHEESSAKAPIYITGYYSSGNTSGQTLNRVARGTRLSPSAIQTDDIMGGFAARGYGTSSFSTARVQIVGSAAENWTNSYQGTYVKINTTPLGSSTIGERMRITGTGVGINTTVNDKALEINSSTGANLRLTNNDADGTADNYADLETTSDGYLNITSSGKNIYLNDTVNIYDAIKLRGLQIVIPTPVNDHTANGTAIYAVAGEALVFGDIVYQKAADGELYKADATNATKMLVRYFVLESAGDGEAILVLKDGYVRDDSWSWTVGGNNLLYAAAGSTAITQTAPTGKDDIVQVLGIPFSTTIIEWNPELSNLELY